MPSPSPLTYSWDRAAKQFERSSHADRSCPAARDCGVFPVAGTREPRCTAQHRYRQGSEIIEKKRMLEFDFVISANYQIMKLDNCSLSICVARQRDASQGFPPSGQTGAERPACRRHCQAPEGGTANPVRAILRSWSDPVWSAFLAGRAAHLSMRSRSRGRRRLLRYLTEDCCRGHPELCRDLLTAERRLRVNKWSWESPMVDNACTTCCFSAPAIRHAASWPNVFSVDTATANSRPISAGSQPKGEVHPMALRLLRTVQLCNRRSSAAKAGTSSRSSGAPSSRFRVHGLRQCCG